MRLESECGEGGGDPGGEEASGPRDLSDPRHQTVSLDIETTGLDPQCQVTCVCVWDGVRGEAWFFRDPDEFDNSRIEILQVLDSARFIMAYNGASFDLPHLARWLGVKDIGPWMAKLIDPHYAAYHLLPRGSTMPLRSALLLNGKEPKSGSGLEAIRWAKEGQWEKLASYCMDDARLTYDLLPQANWNHGFVYCPWGTIFR